MNDGIILMIVSLVGLLIFEIVRRAWSMRVSERKLDWDSQMNFLREITLLTIVLIVAQLLITGGATLAMGSTRLNILQADSFANALETIPCSIADATYIVSMVVFFGPLSLFLLIICKGWTFRHSTPALMLFQWAGLVGVLLSTLSSRGSHEREGARSSLWLPTRLARR